MTINTVDMESKLNELRARMIAAAGLGDLDTIMAIGKEVEIAKKSVAKAENERIAARAKELEAVREAFSEKLGRVVRQAVAKQFPQLDGDLAALDATGLHLTYTIEGNTWVFGGTYPGIKKTTGHKGGGGNRGTASYKLEDGSTVSLKLDEIAAKFGTDEEKAGIEAAVSNSQSWQLKTKVKTATIAAGKLIPQS